MLKNTFEQTDKITKPNKRKDLQALSVSDSEDDEPEGEGPRRQSEVVKAAHWSVEDYLMNEEKRLQRLATRGGAVLKLFSCRMLQCTPPCVCLHA